MTRFLYIRLAWQNVWRNKQTYGPFLLASSLLTFALYSLIMLASAPAISAGLGGTGNQLTESMLWMGVVVVGLFTAIFMIYADSYVIRRRKKEFGLYAVLGMERRHIMRVQLYENGLMYLLTMLFGLVLGAVLTRLMFLLLRCLTHLEIAVSGMPSLPAMTVVACLMGALFVLLLARHALEVVRIRPIALLHASQRGEKEPKARWLLSLVGAACLIAGYVLAFVVNNPADALVIFFIAVILVIIGTYLVFITTSIAILKTMKMRKSFYYTSRHFVTVSGMLFRMKQNAAGLASIAILSTMAMVTIGTTSSLYLGIESTLDAMYPMDMCITVYDEQARAMLMEDAQRFLDENDIPYTQLHTLDKYSASLFHMGEGRMESIYSQRLLSEDFTPNGAYYDNVMDFDLITLEEYNAYTGGQLEVKQGEMAWIGDWIGDVITFGDRSWHAFAAPQPEVAMVTINKGYLWGGAMAVVATEEEYQSIMDYTRITEKDTGKEYALRFNFDGGTSQQRLSWGEKLRSEVVRPIMGQVYETIQGRSVYNIAEKEDFRVNWYALYGAFVFIGIFLGVIFLSGTLLIIYFKQLSEGYQDHERFIILQKVGMSRQDVKHTVRRQVLLVFFAPLVVALCHVAGSLKMIVLMLKMFGISDAAFISICSMGAVVFVVAAYLIFYRRTAKTYYKLVQFTSASEG